jgi:hypothetical protein
MAKAPCRNGRRKQKIDQRIVELGKEPKEPASRRRRRKLVAAVPLKAFCAFLNRQARLAATQLIQDCSAFAGMIGGSGGLICRSRAGIRIHRLRDSFQFLDFER